MRLSIPSVLNQKFACPAGPFRANFGFRWTLETYYSKVVWFRRSREDSQQNGRNLLNHHAGSYGVSFTAVERLMRTFAWILLGAGIAMAVPAQAADGPVKIVMLGDSLSAGLGLPAAAAFGLERACLV